METEVFARNDVVKDLAKEWVFQHFLCFAGDMCSYMHGLMLNAHHKNFQAHLRHEFHEGLLDFGWFLLESVFRLVFRWTLIVILEVLFDDFIEAVLIEPIIDDVLAQLGSENDLHLDILG